jgi:rubredoxin
MTTADESRPVAERWVCTCCGYVYDPAAGDPEHGIAPGTPFQALPDGWVCPLCLALKKAFEPF